MALALIEHIELSVAATSIEFTSIPNDGTDLVAIISLDAVSDLEIQINGLTSGYTQKSFYGYNSAEVGQTNPGGSSRWFFYELANAWTNDAMNVVELVLPNYAGSTAKTAFLQGGAEGTSGSVAMHFGHMANSTTSAISSLKIYNGTNNIKTKSIVSLYKRV